MGNQKSPDKEKIKKEAKKEILLELTIDELFAIEGALFNQKRILQEILDDPKVSPDDKDKGEELLNKTIDAITTLTGNFANRVANQLLEMNTEVVDEFCTNNN